MAANLKKRKDFLSVYQYLCKRISEQSDIYLNLLEIKEFVLVLTITEHTILLRQLPEEFIQDLIYPATKDRFLTLRNDYWLYNLSLLKSAFCKMRTKSVLI